MSSLLTLISSLCRQAWVLTFRHNVHIALCFSQKDLILILAREIKKNQEDNVIKDFWGGKENVREI